MPSELRSQARLQRGESISSPDGRHVLVHQGDGNLVLYAVGASPAALRATWSAGTNGTDAKTAIMQDDGNFVIYGEKLPAKWSSRTEGHPGAWLQVQDDGNCVVYGPGPVALWNTGTAQPPTPVPVAQSEIRLDRNAAGLVLVLSHNMTQQLLSQTKQVLDIVNMVTPVLAAAGLAITPFVSGAIQVAATYLNVERQLINKCDQGKGVYLTLPWLAITFGQVFLIVPTPRY